MAETKEDIAAERDLLREENDELKAQLQDAKTRLAALPAAAGPYRPAQTFQLSEGQRQELAATGVLSVGGRLLTADEVRAKLSDDQRDVDLGTAEPPKMATATPRSAVAGVDYVYPSVAPGQIDPAVAGTPGINGPAADTVKDRE